MELDQFKQKLFMKAQSNGFTSCEIFFRSGSNFEVKIFEGDLKEYKNTESLGISFRGVFEEKMGYAFSEKIDDMAIDFLIANAKENSMIIDANEKEVLFAGNPPYKEVVSYEPQLSTIPPEQWIKDAKIMEQTALRSHPDVKSVDYCTVATGEGEIQIHNTLGLSLAQKSNYFLAFVGARIVSNGQTKIGFESFIGRDYSSFYPESIAKKAVDKAIASLGAAPIVTGSYKTILKNDVMVDLLQAYVGVFFAENVQKGFSLLKGKLGTQIAAPLLTICDDAIKEDCLGNAGFDSEGVCTQNKVVIENGILKTYLYNLKSAAKDGVASTGNGFKSSYKSYVKTEAMNFYIKPTETTLDTLLCTVNDGILITDLSGIHAGVNSVSGDFSLLAEGFQIVNGVLGTPIEQITIAGNFFDCLKSIEQIGDDLYFGMPGASGNIGAPSVYIGTLQVAGTNA